MEILQGVSIYIFLVIFGGLIDLFENNDRQRTPLFYAGSIAAARPVGAGGRLALYWAKILSKMAMSFSYPCNELILQEQKLIER
ncbi:TPA: hypothetical protein RUX58_003217 [Aeromonas dhakensis]|nr:hypothetical protein [Aeromonas dhakensis]